MLVQVIMREEGGKRLEPFEEAIVEVPEEYIGSAVQMLSSRLGKMVDMTPGSDTTTRVKFRIPTRGLIGIRNAMLTASRGASFLRLFVS